MFHQFNKTVVRDQVPRASYREVYPHLWVSVLPVDDQAGLALDLEGGFAVEVVGQEFGAPPIIVEFDAVEPVVGQQAADFWKL